ncbi:MAG: VWA domain-containing protein [Deltaproteobacteria bacterium]|nr:VWA domain-containing protein [Deltaproteobacteria bacterium]
MTTTTTTTTIALTEAQKGPAEKLLDLVLGSSAHLWHNRPGLDVGGTWHAKRGAKKDILDRGTPVKPGLHVPAAERLYARLLDIFRLNAELAARFASYALTQTEWRDLKVACTALMLVQPHAGQPIKDDDGSVSFYDDDYRSVGEAMILFYEKKSTKMLTPKSVLRVAELLENPTIAELNKIAGFSEAGATKAPLGRWKRAAQRWLAVREKNLPMLQGLVKAGYKETIKNIARKSGYKPESQAFFEVLGWKQKQASGGHRSVGMSGLNLQKRDRFDGVSEAEICEAIVEQRLSYKDVVGRLPKDVGLTPAIMVALLPSLSDRDLRMLTPTLEELGLMTEPEIRKRWEKAIAESTDQRTLQIAKNVRSKALKEKLEEASDNAAKKAVKEATAEQPVDVMFLIDKSGSMDGAIDKSKEALSRILAGFPQERVHIASFDTIGTVLKPKAPNRAAVQHMLSSIKAAGGTVHAAAVRALHQAGTRVAADSKLIVIVVGDEAGEDGAQLARAFTDHGYAPAAIAVMVSVASGRGRTVQDCARTLGVPFADVDVAQFEDPYQVPRVLRALLEAPKLAAGTAGATVGWLDKVIHTPILQLPS